MISDITRQGKMMFPPTRISRNILTNYSDYLKNVNVSNKQAVRLRLVPSDGTFCRQLEWCNVVRWNKFISKEEKINLTMHP